MYKKHTKIVVDKSTTTLFNITIGVVLLIILYKVTSAVIFVYNPFQRSVVKKANFAYELIQKEVKEVFNKQGYVYTPDEMLVDDLCTQIANKYSKYGATCLNNTPDARLNFVFKKYDIEVYGMEKPPYNLYGDLVKDFYIDVNGLKNGPNVIGVDKIPMRIYSSGRMGGMLTPVNCNHSDAVEYDLAYSPLCDGKMEINFLTSENVFAFDVFQVGGKNGKTRKINRDVSFLRADCSAFGGELMGDSDYCMDKKIYWLKACYHEYICAIAQSEDKL